MSTPSPTDPAPGLSRHQAMQSASVAGTACVLLNVKGCAVAAQNTDIMPRTNTATQLASCPPTPWACHRR